jgi:hypothetical protein
MADLANIEQRLAALEAEVAQLKRQAAKSETGAEWLDRVSGRFKDDPVFEEIVRLGREAREADRPPDLD